MENIDLNFILSLVIAYLLGNISPSTILGRLHGINIKKAGSGNAGTTNTLRVLGAKDAVITLVIDILKGVMAVVIAGALSGHTAAMAACLCVMLGHVWPVVLKFQGGKGVAVSFGALLALNWRIGLSLLLIVVLAVLITRKVSCGSIAACIAFPFLGWFLQRDFLPFGCVMALIILFKHRANIGRLIRGEEDSIHLGRKNTKKEDHQA